MRNLVPLAITAALLFMIVKLHLNTNWIAISIEEIVIFTATLILAWRMKTTIAFAILAINLAAIGVEFIAHLVYGIHAVQGGPVHITVLATATAGVLLGMATKKAGANAGPDANAV